MKSMWSNDILTDIYIVWMKGLVQLAHSDILTVSQFKQFALENKHIQGGAIRVWAVQEHERFAWEEDLRSRR